MLINNSGSVILKPKEIFSTLTVKVLNIRTPKTFAVITIKFEDGFTEK